MIPEDLRRQLPAEVNPTDISRHALLGSAPGPDFGETHLIIHDAALLAFWRASSTAPLEPLVLAADPLPRLESGDFSSTLILLGPESEHRITVSAAETKAVVAILDALGPVQSTAPLPPKDMGALGVKELYDELAQLGEVGKWEACLMVIDRLVELESEPRMRSKVELTAGQICQEELRDPTRALAYYNRALDDDYPSLMVAFERITEILAERNDWSQLAKSYRRMIKRVETARLDDPGEPDAKTQTLLLALLDGLGEVYRTKLQDIPAAIEVYELTTILDPKNPKRRLGLAELLEQAGPEHLAKAAAQHHKLIAKETIHFDSHHALFRIYMETEKYAEALCVASALHLLKEADPREQQHYEEHTVRGFGRATGHMTDELWTDNLMPRAQSRGLSALFDLLSPTILTVKAVTLQGL